jgi:hypothetical protein
MTAITVRLVQALGLVLALACLAGGAVQAAGGSEGPMIIRVKDNLVYLDAGQAKGISRGAVYDILSTDIISHPLTGDTLAVSPKSVGSIRIHQVFEKLSVGLVLRLEDGVDPMLMRVGRVTDAVRLQEIESMMVRREQVFSPSRSGLSRSYGLVPGLYQIKSGKRGKGWTLLGLEAAALAVGVGYRISSNDWLDQYDRLPQNTEAAVFDSYFDEASNRRSTGNRFLWIAGALYAYNWIDVLWTRSNSAGMAQTLPSTRLDLGTSSQGGPLVVLRHRFW